MRAVLRTLAPLLALCLTSGCIGSTGIVLELMFAAECGDGVFPDMAALHVEVIPCVEDPGAAEGYSCVITSQAELVPIKEDTLALERTGTEADEPVTLLIRDLTDAVDSSVERVRVALTAINDEGNVVAFGMVDVRLRRGELVRHAEPVLVRANCGMPVGPDYDGDGAVGEIDCEPFDPTFVGGQEEVCGNGIDEDCDGIDVDCLPPLNNPADQDEDGYCGIGLEQKYAGNKTVTALCDLFGFTDCDDTDAAVIDVCPCTDADGDGFCAEPAECAHLPGVICNPAGGDCCDLLGAPGCELGYAPTEINPGVEETCSPIDLDCSGADWNILASPCYAMDPASGSCAEGLLCAPPGNGVYGCFLPEAPLTVADVGLCGNGLGMGDWVCVGCDGPVVWSMETDTVCEVGAGGPTIEIAVEAPGTPTTMCSWEVVLPSYPLVAIEAAGSSCTTGTFDVDFGAVPGPGHFALYLRYFRQDIGVDDFVLVVLEVQEDSDCSSADAGVSCAMSFASSLCASL